MHQKWTILFGRLIFLLYLCTHENEYLCPPSVAKLLEDEAPIKFPRIAPLGFFYVRCFLLNINFAHKDTKTARYHQIFENLFFILTFLVSIIALYWYKWYRKSRKLGVILKGENVLSYANVSSNRKTEPEKAFIYRGFRVFCSTL